MVDLPDFEHIETLLNQYQGGEISILKDYWDDSIALVRVSHLEKRNALSGKMLIDLRKCVHELENWKTGKAVILFGDGPNFCSGGDLDFARTENNPTSGRYMSHYMHDILKRFRQLPLITVSLLHGTTVGGGAELSTYSDYILVADNSKLGFIHGRMGLITAWGGTTRLIQILGQQKTLEVLLSSKIYTSQECLDLGLAYRIVDTDNRMDEALNFVKGFTAYDCSIIQSYKKVTCLVMDKSFENSLEIEGSEFYPKWGSQLNKEALSKNIKHVN